MGKIVHLYDADGGADEGVTEHLERLLFVSGDLGRRLSEAEGDLVGESCQSLTDAVTRIMAAPLSPDEADIRLLPELFQSIKDSFDSDAALDISSDNSESLIEC